MRWIETDDEIGPNAAWCRSVGSCVVEDFASPVAGGTVDSLAVVSWNAYLGGGDVVAFVRDLRAGVFTHGQTIEHFVLFLQEVHRVGTDLPVRLPDDVDVPSRQDPSPPSGERIDIVETARRLGLRVFYVPSMRNGPPGERPTEEDRGNAILSTMPLTDLTAIELPFEKYRRVALVATAAGASTGGSMWRLRLCNVHLDNRARFPRYLQSAGVGRLRQARALLVWLTDVPCVLGGDFNTWAPESFETAIPAVRETFRQPVELDPRPTVTAKFLPDRRVDYLFFNLPEGLVGRYERLNATYGSDHYPLLGWVRLTGLVSVNNGEK